MTIPKKNILLLCAEAARHTGTVDLHISAFKDHSQYNVVTLDSFVSDGLDLDLLLFDAIVFHYSIVISLPQYLPDALRVKVEAFKGPKILFIQDEFRWVDRTAAAAKKLGISVVFTVVNKDVIRKIYRDPYFDTVRFEQTLTGFIPENLLGIEVPSYGERTIDIGYRARKLPAWCGSFAVQKWTIGAKFLEIADAYGLKCDIAMSEASRIYGEDWIKFMCNCKATLGTESGASFVDYTGLVHQEIDKYEAAHPKASFEEVRDLYLEGRDNEVVIHVISPRVFEAAALRTLMIMYPGTYSRVLEPGRHYVELKHDHSNMDQVIATLKDEKKVTEILNNAYDEVACSPKWTHKTFIEVFDSVMGEEFAKSLSYVELEKQNIDAIILEKFSQVEKRKQDEVMRVEAEARARAEAQAQAQAEKLKIFARLESLNFAKASRVHKKQKIIQVFQSMRVKSFNFIDQKLPPALSKPLLGTARKISGKIKPLIKKLLLKS